MSEPTPIGVWVWISLWSVLSIGLVGMLAMFAWSFFRKALRFVDDASAISIGFGYDAFDEPPLARPPLAVLQSRAQIRFREAARSARRDELRVRRHTERINRARRITRVNATTVDWPAEWYR